MHYVFVYGTLRRGDSRFGVLDESRCVAEVAFADGFQMLHLGGFPGIVPGDGRIVGEIYEIDDDTLALLDGIEGYHEDDPKRSLYLRQEIDAFYEDGGSIPGVGTAEGRILTYVFNEDGGRMRSGRDVIESGDWFDVSPPNVRTASTSS